MTLVEAVKTCLRKYFVFSGRASRAEFWKFILGIILASILAAILNSVIFGPVTEVEFVVRTTSEGTTQGFQTTRNYGPGPFSTLLGWLVLVPWLAVTARRMHDIGRSLWSLVIAWGAAIALVAVTLLAFLTEVPVSAELRAGVPGLEETITVPQPPVALFLTAWLFGFFVLILSIVWLARQGQPGPNRYGDNPLSERSPS